MLRRTSFLPFAQPDIGEDEIREVVKVLRSKWLTTGEKVVEFEKRFGASVRSSHTLAVNSCTSALHLSLEAVGVHRGDLVITSPYTFASTAEVISYLNASPVFVDIDPVTFNIDVDQLESKLSSLGRQVKAVIPVHMAGNPCEMDEILDLADRFGVAVIEDAAHAFPASYKGRPIGQPMKLPVPHMVCFSFYATKTITTGEGGMITFNDPDLAERSRIMALHGISKDAWKRYSSGGTWKYDIMAPGFKYNMPDILAAIGLVQLEKASKMRDRRTSIARRFNQAFSGMVEIEIPPECADREHAWHLYMMRLNLTRLRIDRDLFINELKLRQIGTSVHFIPIHLHSYYRNKFGLSPEDLPHAHKQFLREISLPIYSGMSDTDVQSVVESIYDIVAKYRK